MKKSNFKRIVALMLSLLLCTGIYASAAEVLAISLPCVVNGTVETFDNYDITKSVAINDYSGTVAGSGLEALETGGKDGGAALLIKTPQLADDTSKTIKEGHQFFKNIYIPQTDTSDIQVFEFDIKAPNDTVIPFEIRFRGKDQSGNSTNSYITFGRSVPGHIVGHTRGTHWELYDDPGRIANAALTLDGNKLSFMDKKWKHIKLEWDTVSKTGKFYVNGKKVAPASATYSVGSGAGDLAVIDNISFFQFPTITFGATQVVGTTESGVGVAILDNFHMYGYRTGNYVSNIETFEYNCNTTLDITETGDTVNGSGSEIIANIGKEGSTGLLVKTPQTTADPSLTKKEYQEYVRNVDIPQADAVDVQVVEFDIKASNDINIPFLLQFYNSTGNKFISFGRSVPGNIVGFYHTGFNWFVHPDVSRVNSATLHVDGSPLSFTDKEWKHIKLEWDVYNQTGKFYVNGQQAAPKSKFNGEDTNIETGAGDFGSIASVKFFAFPSYQPGGNAVGTQVTEPGVEMFVLDNFQTYGYKKHKFEYKVAQSYDLDNSKLTLNINAKNTTGQDETVMCIAGLYTKDGVLKAVNIQKDVVITDGQTIDLDAMEFTNYVREDGDKIKVYMWDGLVNIRPVAEATEIAL